MFKVVTDMNEAALLVEAELLYYKGKNYKDSAYKVYGGGRYSAGSRARWLLDEGNSAEIQSSYDFAVRIEE